VVVNGQTGCCEKGTVCGANGCTVEGYVPCSGQNFCCPAGDVCFLDSNNNSACAVPIGTNTITNTIYSDSSAAPPSPSSHGGAAGSLTGGGVVKMHSNGFFSSPKMLPFAGLIVYLF